MGLDSYLYTASKELANTVADWMEEQNYDEIDVQWCRTKGMIGYWRKYSAIHNWMVENIQGGTDDCGLYELSYTDLKELHKVVTKEHDNPGTTDFQPVNGFFFNPSNIDEWNQGHLDDTYKFLNFLMTQVSEFNDDSIHANGENWDARIAYQSSW